MAYNPSTEQLERYASLVVNYALGSGAGIKRGDVVRINAPDRARPFYVELCKAVWRSGGNVIHGYHPADDADANLSRAFYETATDEQLKFLADKYWKGLVDQCDHALHIACDVDLHALEGVDPSRIMRRL